MKGTYLRKVEARAERWAERFDAEKWPQPPRETVAHALRTMRWMRMPRVEGSLVEADDLIRLVTVDVPALVAEVRRQREKITSLQSRLRDCESRLAQVATHTRTSTPSGPDFCAECSEAISEWVQWPCEGGLK